MSTEITNKEVIKKWVEALESGNYKQGKNRLRRGENYCCLGVLCDLYIEKNPDKATWENNDFIYIDMNNIRRYEDYILPKPILEWVEAVDDLHQGDILLSDKYEYPYPKFEDLDTKEKLIDKLDCTSANDDVELTFEQIAQLLREKYLKD